MERRNRFKRFPIMEQRNFTWLKPAVNEMESGRLQIAFSGSSVSCLILRHLQPRHKHLGIVREANAVNTVG
jgi:hypothetical protein